MSANPRKLPEVFCVSQPSPGSSADSIVRLVFALVFAYFMISAWDDFLSQVVRDVFGFNDRSLRELFTRGVISTILALAVLYVVDIDIAATFGILLYDK